jgi:hypothetical protein
LSCHEPPTLTSPLSGARRTTILWSEEDEMADNAALVQEAYDGFAKGDIGPLLAILDDSTPTRGSGPR